MEREHGKVETSPPKIVDGFFSLLIPPTVREEISGDLCERYSSNSQYAKEVIEMLPYVIANQIRRNTNFPLFGMQAFLIFFCMGGFVAAADAAALEVPRWLRALPPTAVALIALLLRDAYRGIDMRPVRSAGADVAVVVFVVLLSQFLLAALSTAELVSPDWVLSPRRALVAGAALPMLFCIRLVANYRLPAIGNEISNDDLLHDFQRLERNVRWRNRAIAIGGLTAVLTAGPGLYLQAASLPGQIGWAVAFAGGLLVVGYIFFKSSVSPMPASLSFSASLAFYRGELERQSRVLRRVWWWYLLSIVPAIIGAAIGAGDGTAQSMLGSLRPMQVAYYVLICVFVGWLYAQYANSFQTRLKALAAVRELQPG